MLNLKKFPKREPMEFKEKDWLGMKWRVDTSPAKNYPDLMDRFIEFGGFKTDTLSADQLIKYIVFCYHRRSPFVEKIENLIERKAEVMNYLKVGTDKDGYFAKDVQDIIRSSDDKVGKMIIQFCKFENSLVYTALIQTQEAYFKLFEQMNAVISDTKESKDVADVLIKLEKIEDRMKKLANELFLQDKEQANFVASTQVVAARIKVAVEHFCK